MMAREYKDSGIEWIGKIPESWDVKRLKNLCTSDASLIADGDWIESPDISDEGIRYYTTGNIGDGIFKRQGNGFITESTFQTLNCTPVYPGDLVFSRLNSPIGRACIIPDDYPICVVAVDNVIVRPDSKYDKRYIMYISMCPGYQETNMLIARGATMQRMSRTQLQNVDMPIPPLPEQQRIADYLDKKCGEIDELIALQEQMIAQLTDYKQSVITEAVTKGLNPDAELVPSGIDWIGDVPKGWKVTNISKIAQTNSGSTPSNISNDNNSNIVWVRTTDIHDDEVFSSSNMLNENEFKSASCPMLEPGTCLVAMYGGAGTIGKCGILKVKATINQALCSIEVKGSCFNYYLFYVLRAFRRVWMRFAVGTRKDPNINQEIVKKMHIPLPPLSEQQSIATYLDIKCSEIDSLIAIKQQKIETLKDYKKSVIYEAVTGKMTV